MNSFACLNVYIHGELVHLIVINDVYIILYHHFDIHVLFIQMYLSGIIT